MKAGVKAYAMVIGNTSEFITVRAYSELGELEGMVGSFWKGQGSERVVR